MTQIIQWSLHDSSVFTMAHSFMFAGLERLWLHNSSVYVSVMTHPFMTAPLTCLCPHESPVYDCATHTFMSTRVTRLWLHDSHVYVYTSHPFMTARLTCLCPHESPVCDHAKIGLLQCYFRRSSRWINREHTKDPEQRRTAHLEIIEAWSCHTAFERTPLAPSKIPHSVQARNARFPSLWRHSSAIPVFFSLHISTIALPSFFDRKTAQNSKNKSENLGERSFGYIAPTVWNSLLPPSQLSKLT